VKFFVNLVIFAEKPVAALHTELFCNISLHGKRTHCPIANVLFQFRPKFYLLFTPTRVSTYH